MKNTILFFYLSLGWLVGPSWGQSIPQAAGYILKNANYKDFICLGSGKNNFQQGTTPFQFTLIPVDESGNTVLISNGGQFIDLQKVYMSYDSTNGFAWSGLSESTISDSSYMWIVERVANDSNTILKSENPPLYTIRSAKKNGNTMAYLGAFFSGQNPASGNLDVLKSLGPITYNGENAKAFWYLKKADLLAYQYGINSNIYSDTFQHVFALPQAPISGQSAPKFTTAPNATLGLQCFSKWGKHNFVFSAGNKTYTASVTLKGDSILYSNLVEYTLTDSAGIKGWAILNDSICFTDGNYMKLAQFGVEGIVDSYKIGPETKEYSNPVIWVDGKPWVVDSDGFLQRYGGSIPGEVQRIFGNPAFMQLILFDYGKIGYYGADGKVYRYRRPFEHFYGDTPFKTPTIYKVTEQQVRMSSTYYQLKYPNRWANLDTVGTRPGWFIAQYRKWGTINPNRLAVCQYDSILHASHLIHLQRKGGIEGVTCYQEMKAHELVLLGDSMRPVTIATNPVFYVVGKKEDGSIPFYLAVVVQDANGNYQLQHYKLPNFKEAGSFRSDLTYECSMNYLSHSKVKKLARIKAHFDRLDNMVNRWQNDQVRRLFESYLPQFTHDKSNNYSFQMDWNFYYIIERGY